VQLKAVTPPTGSRCLPASIPKAKDEPLLPHLVENTERKVALSAQKMLDDTED
jgi:hypothetical protein